MKTLLILFSLFLVGCGQEYVNPELRNPKEPTPPSQFDPEIGHEELVEATVPYFYNDFSENSLDVGIYEDWYDENFERFDFQDPNVYNTTDDRLELVYTDITGVSAHQFLFHATDGKSQDLSEIPIMGYQTASNETPLSSGDLITFKIYFTVPDNSSVDGVYASLYWLDNQNRAGSDELLLNVDDRFRYGDSFTPLVKGESNELKVTFNLNSIDPNFDFNSIYFDLILEADYSDNSRAKLYVDAVEILRE
jgi:hypothetical protein